MGLHPSNQVSTSNSMVFTKISIFTVQGQKGGHAIPLGGCRGKSIDPAFKRKVKNRLDPKNKVYSSNSTTPIPSPHPQEFQQISGTHLIQHSERN